jgi:hypothetical protein
MAKYRVNVSEIVWYCYSVEADTEEEAEHKARNIWCNDGDEAVDHGEWLQWRQNAEVDGEVGDFFLEKKEAGDD